MSPWEWKFQSSDGVLSKGAGGSAARPSRPLAPYPAGRPYRRSRWQDGGMDTRQLRAFLAVVEAGGISAAAERLGYAQSSVSDQLRTLERDLGTPVLNRTSVGTIPTEAGQRLLPYARRMLDLDAEM